MRVEHVLELAKALANSLMLLTGEIVPGFIVPL